MISTTVLTPTTTFNIIITTTSTATILNITSSIGHQLSLQLDASCTDIAHANAFYLAQKLASNFYPKMPETLFLSHLEQLLTEISNWTTLINKGA